MRSIYGSVAIACVVAWSPLAMADPTAADRALGTKLFDDARALIEKGDYQTACPKLEESERLDPAGGTLMNLGLCYEKTQRFASAWATFREALDVAVREGRSERIDEARARVRELEAMVSRITIVVPAAAEVPGLVVKRDGSALGRRSWGEPMFVDGGEHVVEAEAPGRTSWKTVIVVAPQKDDRRVEVPLLAKPIVVTPPASPSRWTAPVIVSGAIAAVGFGVGIAFAASALSARHDVESACPDLNACTPAGKARNDAALRDADIATVAFAVGGVALASGIFFFVRGPSSGAAALRVAPRAYARGGGLGAELAW